MEGRVRILFRITAKLTLTACVIPVTFQINTGIVASDRPLPLPYQLELINSMEQSPS
jgi:hypothetical protein